MAKKRASPLKWALAIGLLVVIMIGAFVVIPMVAVEEPEEELLITGDCETAPSISATIMDAVNLGTAVSPTNNYTLVDGIYFSSTPSTLAFGDDVEIIYSKTNYLDTKVSLSNLKCGVNYLSHVIYATDDSTIKVFNDDGNVVTDNVAGGATNQSTSATNINQEVKFVANADESSGDLVVVLEATNTTQVDDLILSGATPIDVPEFYTVAGAGSIAKAFEIPALIDGASQTYNLIIQPESGATIDECGIYLTAYSKQYFVDTDGSFVYGVENADGTTKYEDDFDYDWMIT